MKAARCLANATCVVQKLVKVDGASASAVCFSKDRLASYPGHLGGGKSGLVSTVCACAKNFMISWGIVYHRLQTVNLYCIAPKHASLLQALQLKMTF